MPEAAVPIIGSVASSVVGGAINKKSSDKAADAQSAAADAAAAEQKRQYDLSREDLKPYRDTGVKANQTLSSLMGLGEFDRDAIGANIKSKFPSVFGGTTKPAAPAATAPNMVTSNGGAVTAPDTNPYIFPMPYMQSFVPQKMWSQYLKPNATGVQ